MNDFAALAYLEYRQMVNTLRKIAREPGRAILYVLVAFYFAGLGYVRSVNRSAFGAHPHPGVPEPLASALFFSALIFIAAGMFGAAAGRVGAFTSLADARFLIDSRLRERNVIVWLQLRNSWRLIGRLIFAILIYAVMFQRAGTFFGMTFAMIGASAVGVAAAVPIFKLRRSAGAAAGYLLAGVVGAAGVVPLALVGLGYVWPSLAPLGTRVVHAGFGGLINRMLAGDWRPLAVEYAIFALLVIAAYFGATDLYPELYAGSQRMIAWRERTRRRGFSQFQAKYTDRSVHAQSRSRERSILPGAFAIFWKEWLGFRRSPGLQLYFWIGVAVAVLLGGGGGIAAHASGDPEALALGLGTSAGNLLVIFLALGSSVALAADIRKPIWWLSADPIRARLYAWVAAASWRFAAIIALGVVACSIAAKAPMLAIVGVPGSILLVLYLRSIGLALYALFPSNFDQRGPVAMLRVLLTYLLAAPAITAGVIAGILAHGAIAGALGAFAACIVEMVLLAEFAAYRIARGGAAFASAEVS